MLVLEGTSIKHDVENRLLLNIDLLQVHENERIGIVGRNGSGKTTLLEIIAREIVPDQGDISQFTTCVLVPQFKKMQGTKSGGEMTQHYLQSALNEAPGLLILDEPTTHLDQEHIVWLEEKLELFKGALLLVSHDRAFLNHMCTEIWELEDAKMTVYKGNYDDYAAQKSLEDRQDQAAFEQYIKEKQALELAIRKKEEKAKRATKKPKNLTSSESRIKGAKPYFANKQKKLRKTVSAFETRLEQLEAVDKPKERPPIEMSVVNEAALYHKIIIRGEAVAGQIEDKLLWQPFDLQIRNGEKVAVIGPNGAGKTTFLKKIIHGDAALNISQAVRIGYFSQHLTILNDDQTILTNVKESSMQSETLIRIVLAQMGFRKDDVLKEVAVLSGGEKVKVALAKLFLSDVNMLVLDEPTNFLDIESVEAFESLISDYKGTVIFATHDRMFIENIANKIIDIRDQAVEVFDGSYAAYQQRLEAGEKDDRDEQLLLIETKISDVLGRMSLEPPNMAELEEEFQALLAEKRKLSK